MKRLVLLLSILWLTSIKVYSQTAMWVGESKEFDASSAVIGLTANVNWTITGGYVSLSGSGFYRRVTITQYFSGNAYLECSWQYKLYSNDTYKTQRKTWTITCNENPVSIYPTTLTLAPGQTYQLSYSHKFSNQYTSAANAYFASDGGGGAITVTRDGLVTAKEVGKAYVNVYSKISSASNAPYCLVTVKEIEPTSVSIDANLTLVEGQSYKLTPTLYPSGASSGYVWSSADPSIAQVSTSGNVTAVKQGKTRVTVTTSKGGYTDYCDVTVKAPPVSPTHVELPEQISIYKGFSTIITPVLQPSVAESTFKWSSDNTLIVSVTSSGKITANAVGECTIMVTTANNLTASCKVHVVEVPQNINTTELLKRITLLNNLSQSTLNYIE